RMASHIARRAGAALGELVGRNLSILDYGGGDGSISAKVAQELIKRGAEKVDITLVDYDKSTVATTGGRIQFSRPSDLTQIDEKSMHLVIASAVVEHIPEARGILIKLLSALKQ